MQMYYLPEQTVCNPWMKKEYAWFVDGKEVKVDALNGGAHISSDYEFFYHNAQVDLDVDSTLFDAKIWGKRKE